MLSMLTNYYKMYMNSLPAIYLWLLELLNEFSGVNGYFPTVFLKEINSVGEPLDNHLNNRIVHITKTCIMVNLTRYDLTLYNGNNGVICTAM